MERDFILSLGIYHWDTWLISSVKKKKKNDIEIHRLLNQSMYQQSWYYKAKAFYTERIFEENSL